MRAYRHRKRRQAISTREWIRDILETWHGDWFTTKQLAVAVSEASGTAETTVRRAVNRLVNAAPNWLETQVLDGERRYRAQQRSYLWT